MGISSSSSSDPAAKEQRNKTARGKARYRIGDVTRLTGLAADTLLYSEKIRLLPRVNRPASGIRVYTAKDISLLHFIQRAQKMNFSLAEIGAHLEMRKDPLKER